MVVLRVAGLTFLMVLGWSIAALGVDFNVADTVSATDTASCGTGGNPNCATITFALGARAAAAPDRVLVMDGTYDTAGGEAFPISLKNGVSIIGNTAMPENVNVIAPFNAFESAGPLSSSTVISGLTIMPGTSNTPSATSSATAIFMGSFSGSDVLAPVIENNRFIDGSVGVDIHNSSFTFTSNSANIAPTIRNNFFTGQAFAGVHMLATLSGSSQKLGGILSNNTMDSAFTGILVEASNSASVTIDPMITMNTINDPVSDAIDVSIFELDNFDNSVIFMPTITQNIITNPGDDGIDVDFDQDDQGFLPQGVVQFKPTITSNTVTGNGSGDAGIQIEISNFTTGSSLSLSVSADITVTGNTVTGMGGDGIELNFTDIEGMGTTTSNSFSGVFTLAVDISNNPMVSGNGDDGIDLYFSDWDTVSSVNIGTVDIKGNTVTGNGDSGIVVRAIDINSSAVGFDLSPTIANNTVTGNMGTSTGIFLKYSDSGVAGTALLSSNTVTGNDGTGVLLLFGGSEGPAEGPVKVALRGNTISGNSGDAVKISGSSGSASNAVGDATLNGTLPPGPGARGDYEVDLGGGFMGGNGLNVIQGNTSGSGGDCTGGAFCDINNIGEENVAALCNQFTETDLGAEEDWLNDANDDGNLGDVTPISVCQVFTATPTATATPTVTATATASETATATATATATVELPDGVVCSGPGQCASGFCVDGVCCENACNGATEACNISGQEGTCLDFPAPAPATSPRVLAVAVALLLAIAGLALLRRRGSFTH